MSNELRKAWREAGLCSTCGAEPEQGKKQCRPCLDKKNAVGKACRAKKMAKRVCIFCNNAPAIEGKSRCQTCIDKGSLYSKQRRAGKKSVGICSDCSEPALPHSPRCQKCYDKNKNRSAERRQRLMDLGLCHRCGKEKATLHTQRCERCNLKSIAHDTLGDRSRWGELWALFVAQRGLCAYTRAPLFIGFNASIDHRIPTSKGGTDDLSNLQWVELEVNKMKWDQDEHEFLERCERITLLWHDRQRGGTDGQTVHRQVRREGGRRED